jgi:FkbM family methyltransferase
MILLYYFGKTMISTKQSVIERSVNFIPWRIRHWIRSVPGLAQFQRQLFSTFLADREFVHRINAGPAMGLNYLVQLPQDKQIWTGTYEAEVATKICDAVVPGQACFDIGAHRGFLSGVMAVAGASEVHCFDPNPENTKQLRSLSELNPELKFVVHEMAVGNHTGTVEFVLMPETSMGKVLKSDFQPEAEGMGKLAVNACRLDDLIATGKIPPPGLIKIDVEGAEELVLEGGAKLFEKHRPNIILEAHSQKIASQCIRLLKNFGYEVEPLNQQGIAQHTSGDSTSHWIGRAA